MTLADLRKLAPDMQVVVPVGQLLHLIEEAAREKGGVARWVRLNVAAEIMGLKPNTLNYRARSWHAMQLAGKRPPVRVTRLSERGAWLFDEDDCYRNRETGAQVDEDQAMLQNMVHGLLSP